jgi:hypothetical protein
MEDTSPNKSGKNPEDFTKEPFTIPFIANMVLVPCHLSHSDRTRNMKIEG